MRGRQRVRVRGDERMEARTEVTERFKGAMNKECRHLLESGKEKETDSLEPPEGVQLC